MTQTMTWRLAATLLVAGFFSAGATAQAQMGPAALMPPGVPTGMAIVADSVVGGDRTSSFWTFPARRRRGDLLRR
jgi:hypothetical protein